MLLWVLNLGFAASPPGLVTVPDVTGETQAQATIDITALGLTASVQSAYSDTVAIGLVVSQSPAGGSLVSPGSDVSITVSLGPQPAPQVMFSGGFLYEYQREQINRAKRRREREEREAEAERLADETSREIARFLHAQEQRDQERAELERLRALAKSFRQRRETADLSNRVKQAYARVLAQENFSAVQALDRELQRMLEEEEIAALMLLLNED